MAVVIAVLVDFEPQRSDVATNVIEIPSDMTWSDFELVLRVAFGLESAVVKYIDEDEDVVTISSNDELKEAIRVARMQNNTLHLKLCSGVPAVVDPPATYQPPPPSTTPRDVRATSASSLTSSDDSVTMEAAESNKDTTSSPESSQSRCFFLRHEASQLVLDVEGWQRTAGTRVILYPQKMGQGLHGCENQLFQEDEETGTIRSYFCGLCLDGSESGLTLQPFSPGKQSQRWKMMGKRLQNGEDRADWVLGVKEARQYRSTCPAAMSYQATPLHHWTMEYNIPSTDDEMIHFLLPAPQRMMSQVSKHKQNLYAELAHEMSVHLSQAEGGTALTEASAHAPKWFTDYMEQFKKDLCEEISSLVTRKTVRRILNSLMEGHPNPAATSPAGEHVSLDHHQRQQLVHHFGVVCDACDRPINGVRYKCGNCEDYDLCGPCEAKITENGGHDTDHVFIKIRRPAMAFPRKKTGRPAPLLKRSLYPTDEEIQRIQEKMLRKQEKYRRRGEKHEEKLKRREDKLKRRHEFLREIPSKKEKLEFPLLAVPFEKFDANFVRDDNYPDGTSLLSDVRITKRWVMCNTGTHPWNEHTKLTLMWGNIPVVLEEVAVPPLQPKEEGVIAVEFTTPAHPGVYQSHWRMSHKNFRFGHRVWCSIVVVLPEEKEEQEKVSLQQVPAIKEEVGQEDEEEVAEVAPASNDEDVIIDVGGVDEETVVKETGERTVNEKKSSAETDILSAQDILSFEMLDIRDRNTPKVSQTATPTNTPMAMTPPKSPVGEMEEGGFRHLSTSSSVEIVSESSEESTSHMTELVQERIAKLGLKPDHLDDIETISTCSEDSDSDSDFYIVPLPDCFNPNLPLSASTSTSVVMSREEVQKTVDDILTASKNLATPALIPPLPETIDLTRDEDEEEEEGESSMVHVDLRNDNTSDDVSLLAFETSLTEAPPEEVTEEMSPVPEAQAVAMETVPTPVVAPLSPPVLNAPPEITTDENANSVPSTPEGASTNRPPGDSTSTAIDLTGSSEQGEGQTMGGALEEAMKEVTSEEASLEAGSGEASPQTDVKSVAGEGEKAVRPDGINIPPRHSQSPSSTPQTPPSPSVLASSLMTAAIGVATQAAATAYTTAKDVFHTLQASKEYVPPKSNWKPPQQKWSPPKQDFTLPKETWTPPSQTWTPAPPGEPAPTQLPAPPEPLTEMEQLVEMGFADRKLNATLLKKYDSDVQKVVQDLVNRQDNDWHQNRH